MYFEIGVFDLFRSLADIDGDGRLSCEEYILAMHLTDMVKRGEQLPVKLTPELVPPTFRRLQQQMRRMSGAAVGITPNDVGETIGLPIYLASYHLELSISI